MVQYPKRVANVIKRILGLTEGRYVITLTVKADGSIFTVTPMGKLEQ